MLPDDELLLSVEGPIAYLTLNRPERRNPLGLSGDGGAWLLPRAIGWSRAAQLFFTGDVIDSAAACAQPAFLTLLRREGEQTPS